MPAHGRIPRPKHLFPDLAAVYFQLRRWGLRVERFFHEDAGWYPVWTIGAVSGTAGLMLAVLLFLWYDPPQTAVAQVEMPPATPVVSTVPEEQPTLEPQLKSSLQVEVLRTRVRGVFDQRLVETSVSHPRISNINLAALTIDESWRMTPLDRPQRRLFEPYVFQVPHLAQTPVQIVAANHVDPVRATQPLRIAGLEVEKVMAENASVGSPYTYWIFVRNTSGDVVPAVTVRERLSAIQRVSAVEPAALVEADELVWHLNQIPPGDLRKLTVTLMPDQHSELRAETSLEATAVVSASAYVRQAVMPTPSPEPIVPLLANDPVVIPEPAPVPLPDPGRPDLRLSVSKFNVLTQGDILSLVFLVKNVGTADAENVAINVELSPEFEHRYGRLIEHRITKLAPGESHRAILRAVASQPGTGELSTQLTMMGDAQERARLPIPVQPGAVESEPTPAEPISDRFQPMSTTGPTTRQLTQRITEELPLTLPLAPLESVRRASTFLAQQ
ncbi:MAG: hypothetical protein KDA58_12605 [Planctomycetaceae bacterium]|nr:hypothetical protein [Planctomycetaceae bacterium]